MSGITINSGVTLNSGITFVRGPNSITIPLNSDGGISGWGAGNNAASIPYSATIIAEYPVGSIIRFQDNTTSTITQWDPYGPNYIDIVWTGSKINPFPITLIQVL